MNKTLYFDTETTGLDPVKNDIIQIAGMIEIDGQIKEAFNFKCQPFSYENISIQALETHKMTIEQIKGFEAPSEAYKRLTALFDKYVSKFDRSDKFIVAGYNVDFDIRFLEQFFKKNGDDYLFSYLGQKKDPLGVINYMKSMNIIDTPNAKLTTMCEYFGVKIENAHDAMGDIEATKNLIKIIDRFILRIYE